MIHPEERRKNRKKLEQTLMPCPFCGSKGELHRKGVGDDALWIVECANDFCPASYMIGNVYSSKEKAIEAWNTRAKV